MRSSEPEAAVADSEEPEPGGEHASFRDIARSSRSRAEAGAQARYVKKKQDLIASLERAGHSVSFSTRRVSGEGGSSIRVTMACDNCWKKYRGPLHRWWGLSPNRPCR